MARRESDPSFVAACAFMIAFALLGGLLLALVIVGGWRA
jgi:hypothetical protein